MTPNPIELLTDPAVLGFAPDGSEIPLDLHDLRVGILAQASSGGGKSFLLRRLNEQSHGKVLIFYLDREGDAYTLREKFRFALIGGEGADAPALTAKAGDLALKFLRGNVSAIINISELSQAEWEEDEKGKRRIIEQSQPRYVAAFLRGLMSAPRADWKKVLVFIDEAHLFAPKEGSRPSSFKPVVDLMSLGRKRGFIGVLATQRIAKIHNDAIADAHNKVVGLCSLSTDRERGAEEIGMPRKEALVQLGPELAAGEFFCVGPAFHAKSVVKVKVGTVVTTHPEPGGLVPPVPPAPAELRAILAGLAASTEPTVADDDSSAPRTAAKDDGRLKAAVAENEQLRAKVAHLEAENRIRKVKATNAGFLVDAIKDAVKRFEADEQPAEIAAQIHDGGTHAGATGKAGHGGGAAKAAAAPASAPAPAKAPPVDVAGLKSGAAEMLRVLVVLGKPVPRKVLGAIAGVSITSGTVSDYTGQLLAHAYVVEQPEGLQATAAGKAKYPKPGVMPTGDELLERHGDSLKEGAVTMVNYIRKHGPTSRKDLAKAAGVSSTSGTVSDYVTKLKRCGLVEDEGGLVRLSRAWSFCRG